MGRSPGEGIGYPLQYSCLENSMDRRAWLATVYRLQKIGHDWVTFTFTLTFIGNVRGNQKGKQKEGLPWWLSSKESTCQCRRPGFDPWVGKIPWRKKWQPTPALLPGKSHGQGSQQVRVHRVAKESDMTSRLNNNNQKETGFWSRK